MSQLADGGDPAMHDELDELDGGADRPGKPAEAEDNSWTGTIVGLALASAALATILLT